MISGTMFQSGCAALTFSAALMTARVCMAAISGKVTARRQPRWPIMGLNSCREAMMFLMSCNASCPCPWRAARCQLPRWERTRAAGDRGNGRSSGRPSSALIHGLKVALLHRLELGRAPSRAARRCRSRSSRGWRECGRPRRTCARCGRGRCPQRRTSRPARRHGGYRRWCGRSRRRYLSAQLMTRPNSPRDGGVDGGDGAVVDVAGGAVDGDVVALVIGLAGERRTSCSPRPC